MDDSQLVLHCTGELSMSRVSVSKSAVADATAIPTVPAVGFLDVRGAAKFLSVSKALLDKLRTTGGGPRFCRAGRKIIYRNDELLAWASSRSFTSNAESHAAEGSAVK